MPVPLRHTFNACGWQAAEMISSMRGMDIVVEARQSSYTSEICHGYIFLFLFIVCSLLRTETIDVTCRRPTSRARQFGADMMGVEGGGGIL